MSDRQRLQPFAIPIQHTVKYTEQRAALRAARPGSTGGERVKAFKVAPWLVEEEFGRQRTPAAKVTA